MICAKEAQRRFHSLKTHVLTRRYAETIRVFERMKKGRIHYHLLVVMDQDIRTGANFEEFAQGDYRSANARLRSEWAFWRKTAPAYRFGRTETLPVKSTSEGIARYVGKYIAKHIGQRKEEDKGVRLVAYSRGAGVNNCKFDWNTPGARCHRRKLAWMATMLGYSAANYSESFTEDYGSRWGFVLREVLHRVRFTTYPTLAEAAVDWPELDWSEAPAGSTNIVLTGSSYEAKARLSHTEALLVAFNERKRQQGRRRARPRPLGNNFKTSNQPSTQRDPTRSEHCQGGDFCASDATDVLDDWMRKNTTFTSATQGYNESARVG